MGIIDKAFQAVPRQHFLPEEVRAQAWLDAPLPIGFGQTNSQPSTVYRMLEWLDAEPGNKVLDVGAGSGWTSALLGYIVGKKGRVYAVEKIPEILDFGRHNVEKLGVGNVRFFKAGLVFGLPQSAPFDRILVSAAAAELPTGLIKQLKIGGRLVVPVKNDILVIDKLSDTETETEKHSGYQFVPLV